MINPSLGFKQHPVTIKQDDIGLTDPLIGLSAKEISLRRRKYGMNTLPTDGRIVWWKELFNHFKSPLIILLLFAALVSFTLSDVLNASIILTMIFLSVLIDYYRERRAVDLADSLKKIINTKVAVIRDGSKHEIIPDELVPGDIIQLQNGKIIPADSKIIFTDGLFVDQSTLTGESFPVLKTIDKEGNTELTIFEAKDRIFMGCSIVGGSATAQVMATGTNTEFGKVFRTVIQRNVMTDFAIGMNKFGMLILKISITLMLFIFFVNAVLNREILESFVFAIAVAVGLTPELLPMIMSLTMSKGAVSMGKKGVIVKQMPSIPNLGTMEILCTDKTGTLTEGTTSLVFCININQIEDERIFHLAYINSYFQADMKSPLDTAILTYSRKENSPVANAVKLFEIPYDFYRKKISVIYKEKNQNILVCKGAPEEIFRISNMSKIELEKSIQQYEKLSREGYRTLAIAERTVPKNMQFSDKLETDLNFVGFAVFEDPVKSDADDVVNGLKKIGIEIKIITGDNNLVTESLCRKIGLEVKGVLEGSVMDSLTDEALRKKVISTTIFARFTPSQKMRIIEVLKSCHHCVGYLGDGINDAPSLKSADIGISVNSACDVAKQAADMILTQKDLLVLKEGIIEGRKTVSNSMKYVLMCISSNFGNMFSIAIATLFLPFFPMLPIQILINNFLYDSAQINLPSDDVDEISLIKPQIWDLNLVRTYMLFYGLLSSIFDMITFWLLYHFFGLAAEQFRTGWFMESLATQILVVFIIRTPIVPFYKSRPSKKLLFGALSCLGIGWLLPYLPFSSYLGFQQLPFHVLTYLFFIILIYLASAEALKYFIQHFKISGYPTFFFKHIS